jgi:hypothetical protein
MALTRTHDTACSADGCGVIGGEDWDSERGPGPYGGAWYPPQQQSQPHQNAGYRYPPPPEPRSRRSVITVVAVIAAAFVGAAGIGAAAAALISTRHHDSRAATGFTAPVSPVSPARTEASPTPSAAPAQPAGWVPITIDHPVPGTQPLPAALSATSLSSGVVVTPTLARSVVQAIWVLRQQAFTSHDRSFMAEFESGAALESDERTCGCNSRSPRGPISAEVVFVPRQTRYPVTFLAEAATTLTGDAYTQYLVISKASATSRWTVVADPGDSEVALDRPSTDAAGFNIAPAPSARTPTLAAVLANYWQTWTDTGLPPTSAPFGAGAWTTAYGAELASQPQGSLYRGNGLDGNYRYQSVASDPTWAFGTATGGITCGVLRAQTVWTAPGGGPIYQPPARTNWGPTVAPGIYRAEASTDIVEPCFIQHSGDPVTVTSGDRDSDTEQGIDPYPVATTPTMAPS